MSQEQVNLIRRSNLNGQKPDSAITQKITEETHFHYYILWRVYLPFILVSQKGPQSFPAEALT